jgi:glycosyltransferase involved in cell wall biosynthesis
MVIRYLFGPVPGRYGTRNLARQRRAGACKTFGPDGADVGMLPGDTWESVCGRLSADWRPDFLVLALAAAPVPAWVWSAPLPRVGLALGWPLLWHAYRRQLAGCELVLADPAGAARLAAAGLPHVRAANLYGCERLFLEHPWPPADARDLDILVVSNLPPAALRLQLPLLGRLARLGHRWRVCLRAGVYGADYRRLLGRSRIVVNHSLAGEGSYRACEAAAAGALLFQEADNQEIPALLRDHQECVLYREDDLEELLEHYLANEAERRRLAEAARRRATACCFEELWEEQVTRLAGALPSAVAPAASAESHLLARCWRVLGQPGGADGSLADDLHAAVQQQLGSAALHLALGLTLANAAATPAGGAAVALPHLQAAVQADPANAVAVLNTAEALALVGDSAGAADQARRALDLLGDTPRLSPAALDAGHFPPAFDAFRVEWERAAWANAGDPPAEARAKHDLLRWRTNALLAELTGDLSAAYEAVLARPDLPATRALLGRTLHRAGHSRAAAAHFARALSLDPFHADAARSLAELWRQTGDQEQADQLAADRRLLAQASPQLVPAEPWFAAAPPAALPARCSTPEEPSPAAPAAVADHRPPTKRISLTMIVRNEEHHLPDCLASVVDLVDEVIIADTGSADRTRDVAARFGARVVEFPWADDFAAARNAALRHAAGAWVWWLDADDRLDADNRRQAAELFGRLGAERDAYAMKVRSRLNPAGTAFRFLDQVRLFPNHPDVRWRYRVHEQIMPAVREHGGDLRWADVTIDHVGYQDRKARRGKLERNLRLLRRENADRPDDPYTLFNLGWTLLDLGKAGEAIGYLSRCLGRVRPTVSYVRKLYVLLLQAYNRTDRRLEAFAVATEGLSRFPEDAELLYERAVLLHESGKQADAEASLRRLLATPPGQYLASVDGGLRGYRARHLLGEVCRVQGRPDEAEEHWRAAVAERPDYAPVWAALGQLWLGAGRWDDVEEAGRRLDTCDGGEVDAIMLRAQGQLARGEAEAARRLLEEASARLPRARPLRQLLKQLASGPCPENTPSEPHPAGVPRRNSGS